MRSRIATNKHLDNLKNAIIMQATEHLPAEEDEEEAASALSLHLLFYLALAPVISSIITLQTPWEAFDQQSEDVLSFDFAASAWLILAAVTGLTLQLDENIFVTIWGLISWISGAANLKHSWLLLTECTIVFFLLGSRNSGLSSPIHSILLLLSPIWMGGFPVSQAMANVTIQAIGLDHVQNRWSQGRYIVRAALLLQCVAMLSLRALYDGWSGSMTGISLAAWYLGVAKDHCEKIISVILFMSSLRGKTPSVALSLVLVLVCLMFVRLQARDRVGDISNSTLCILFATVLWRNVFVASPGISRFGVISTSVAGLAMLLIPLTLAVLSVRLGQSLLPRTRLGQRQIVALLLLCLASRTPWISPDSLGRPDVFVAVISTTFVALIVVFVANTFPRSRLRTFALCLCLVLFWFVYALFSTALPHKTGSWYSFDAQEQKRICASLALSGRGRWVALTQSKWLAVDQINAYTSAEPVACRTTFPTPVSDWSKTTVLVVGDSIGRFIFYAMANAVVAKDYGYPKGAFHGNIIASDGLQFVWAPYAADLSTATNNTSANVIIVSSGLWDKLWKRDAAKFQAQLTDFLSVLGIRRFGKLPTVVLLEMTRTVDDHLLGPDKQQYLVESTAPEWRAHAANALKEYAGPAFLVPTVAISAGRMSRDGVHYPEYVYETIVSTILRGIPLSA